MIMNIPDEDSSLSSLLTSQSRLLENWVQLFLFPLINAAAGHKESVRELNDDSVCWTAGYRTQQQKKKEKDTQRQRRSL